MIIKDKEILSRQIDTLQKTKAIVGSLKNRIKNLQLQKKIRKIILQEITKNSLAIIIKQTHHEKRA